MLMPFVNILQFTNGGRMRESVVRFWPMLAGLAASANREHEAAEIAAGSAVEDGPASQRYPSASTYPTAPA